MNVRRVSSGIRSQLKSALGLGLVALALVGPASAQHKAPAKAPTHRQQLTAVQASAMTNFLKAWQAFDAAKRRQGHGSNARPHYLINGDKPGGVSHLCKAKATLPAKACVAPGSEPAMPPSFKPRCKHCDKSARDAAWEAYNTRLLALEFLSSLRTLNAKMGYWGEWLGLANDIYDFLSALTGPGAIGFKAAKWAGGQILTAATSAAKAAATKAAVQAVLDALGTGMNADDLSSAAAFDAAMAKADLAVKPYKTAYEKANADWKKCRSDAAGAQQVPVDSAAEANACNQAAQAQYDASMQAAITAWFAWLKTKRVYEACLEHNRHLEVEIATYQTTPCPPGTAVGN